ncbi:unnamed protein product [Ectocarpus sp. 12 AP-2014]
MSSITLTYFDIPGPAEAIRLAFYVGGIPFKDRRVSRQEFAKIKQGPFALSCHIPDLPFAQLPILTVDEEVFPQSAAILRYAGKIGGLYPSDPIAAAKVDAVIDCMFDIQAAIRPSIYETNAQRKLSMRKELSEVTLPLWLQYLERWLERAGTTFFVGEEITICDLVIYTRMKWLRRGVLVGIPDTILRNFRRVRAHSEAVASHPKVDDYYKNGPGKVTGDGSPPIPPSPHHSPLSPITLPSNGD